MSCLKCGRCCRILLIKIKKQDEKMRELTRMRNIPMIDIDDKTSIMMLKGFPCKHLNIKTNLCAIYRERPSICKNYPTENDVILVGCGFEKPKNA